MARRTPRRLDDYRRGQRERDIEREAQMRDRRYSDVADRIVDDYLREDRDEVLRTMVNDVELVVTPELVDIINDPDIEMTKDMRIQKKDPQRGELPLMSARNRRRSGSAFASQFRFDKIQPRTTKRTRKKTSTDKKMSKALKQANAKLRNKNGKLKKGKTMKDVMKMAHRLRKK